jgi:WD40 repeat protein
MKKIFSILLIMSFTLSAKGHYATINKFIYDKNNHSIISIGKDEQIIIWNLENYKNSNIINLNKGSLTSGTLMKEKEFLVCSSLDGSLYFISLGTNTLVDIKNPNVGILQNVYFTTNNSLLILGKSGSINLYNYQSDRILKKIKINGYITSSYIYENFLFFSTENYELFKLNLNDFQLELLEKNIHSNSINNLYIKNNILFFSSWNNDLLAYNLKSKKIVFTKFLDKDEIVTSINSYKNFIITTSNLGNTYLYDSNSFMLKKILKGIENPIKSSYIVDNLIFNGHENGYIEIFNLDTYELIKSIGEF